MNFVLIILYIILAVAGSTLIKYGGKMASSFTLPLVNVHISLISVFGIFCYGLSFLFYVLLLNKFDLSFISPVTIGLVYVLLMITAVIFFKENFTIVKVMGCLLIIVGVLLITLKK